MTAIQTELLSGHDCIRCIPTHCNMREWSGENLREGLVIGPLLRYRFFIEVEQIVVQ